MSLVAILQIIVLTVEFVSKTNRDVCVPLDSKEVDAKTLSNAQLMGTLILKS